MKVHREKKRLEEESRLKLRVKTLERMWLRTTGQVCWVAGACLSIVFEQAGSPFWRF